MEQTNKAPLGIILGPTASGKTSLGVQVAKRLGGEVISADSIQIYRGLDIGSAKPTCEEMEGVPHHMLDVAEVDGAKFSVAAYQQQRPSSADCSKHISFRWWWGGRGCIFPP